MDNLSIFFANAWKWKCGLPEDDLPIMGKSKLGNHRSFEELQLSEYPKEFEEIHILANNRMIMGSFRYGYVNRQDLNSYNTANEAHKRINKYQLDNNLEHLIDAYNMVRLEFLAARRKGLSIISIDDGEHATKK